MRLSAFCHRPVVLLVGIAMAFLSAPERGRADPSKYPQFAQEKLPENVTPVFVNIEELVADLKAGAKPIIIDVRTEEEFGEVHILGAVSAPLAEFKDYLKSIPRDRPVVLY
ncbi:MAG TPA: rhodanese-like domain-containing protein [Candidatus Binatia bacterium]